jgi:hypothetical protein
MANKEIELGFDITSKRVGWNLTTFLVEIPGDVGDFVDVLENVPLTVQEAVSVRPDITDWIISETQKHVETLAEQYPADMDRLRTELAAVR